MKKFLPPFLLGMLLVAIPTVYAVSKGFIDVRSDDWFQESVLNLSEKGIIKGYNDGSFGPANPVSRAELAVMLDRMMTYVDEKIASVPINVKESQTPPPKNTVEVQENIPNTETLHPVTVKENSVTLSGETLNFIVEYIACSSLDIKILWDGTFIDSVPVGANLYITPPKKSEKTCTTGRSQAFEFDLTPLRDAYVNAYKKSEGTLEINVLDTVGNKRSAEYVFSLATI
ncbi:S-layer homology domain-containing protein [Candidatus Peregrinibacteria bacterium]|nr:S-layer homology domain-containing protein [Candidatus Peregrinibacteria bacterium]